MSKNMDPNGSTWAELQKQLYAQTEIEESRRRVAAVKPQAAAGDFQVTSGTRKNAQKLEKNSQIGFELILRGFELVL